MENWKMWYGNFRKQTINLQLKTDRILLEEFLMKQNLALDHEVEYTISFFDRGNIIATGSLEGRILKCIAVDEQYQSVGLSAAIVTHLIQEAYSR
jgi:[citrate (pro-3S)-lyase] ligase